MHSLPLEIIQEIINQVFPCENERSYTNCESGKIMLETYSTQFEKKDVQEIQNTIKSLSLVCKLFNVACSSSNSWLTGFLNRLFVLSQLDRFPVDRCMIMFSVKTKNWYIDIEDSGPDIVYTNGKDAVDQLINLIFLPKDRHFHIIFIRWIDFIIGFEELVYLDKRIKQVFENGGETFVKEFSIDNDYRSYPNSDECYQYLKSIRASFKRYDPEFLFDRPLFCIQCDQLSFHRNYNYSQEEFINCWFCKIKIPCFRLCEDCCEVAVHCGDSDPFDGCGHVVCNMCVDLAIVTCEKCGNWYPIEDGNPRYFCSFNHNCA